MTLTYGSVCSGIEAVTQAWHPLGMKPAFFAETDEFCNAVLAHHWPEVQNLGDFTKIQRPNVDVLVGGTPCQSFSQSGGRAGLCDPRGHLAIEFLLLAARLQARWVVWENVPGVLFSGDADPDGDSSVDDERGSEEDARDRRNWLDLGTILGALGQLGYGFAYRILDAQHFGVGQRRRRLFVVGYLGDWRPAAAVLLERESMRGLDPPSRAKGEDVAGTLAARAPDRSPDFSGGGVVPTLTATHNPASVGLVAPALTTRSVVGTLEARAPERSLNQENIVYNVHPVDTRTERNALVAKETTTAEALTAVGPQRRCDRGDLVVTPIQGAQVTENKQRGVGIGKDGDPSYTLTTRHDTGVFVEEPIPFDPAQVTHPENRSKCEPGQPATSLTESGQPHIAYRSVVRRLTPREYERLQGFPDDHTLIRFKGKPAADGRRYKAVGNSMAVPVMAWLGRRILMVENILASLPSSA